MLFFHSQSIIVLLGFLSSVTCLRFDLLAGQGDGTKKCYMQWITKDSKVTGKIVADPGDGQVIDVEVTDSIDHNKFWSKKTLEGESTFSFLVNTDTNIKICVTNTLASGTPQSDRFRAIHLTIDSKQDSFSSHEKSEHEKAEPLFAEIRLLEEISSSASSDVWYFTHQSDTMAELNEGIWARVRNFSFLSIVVLILCAVGQTWYFYTFFKAKKLI